MGWKILTATFGAKEEYGKLAVSTFAIAEDWRSVEDDERRMSFGDSER